MKSEAQVAGSESVQIILGQVPFFSGQPQVQGTQGFTKTIFALAATVAW